VGSHIWSGKRLGKSKEALVGKWEVVNEFGGILPGGVLGLGNRSDEVVTITDGSSYMYSHAVLRSNDNIYWAKQPSNFQLYIHNTAKMNILLVLALGAFQLVLCTDSQKYAYLPFMYIVSYLLQICVHFTSW
jgi:hypothetical protein